MDKRELSAGFGLYLLEENEELKRINAHQDAQLQAILDELSQHGYPVVEGWPHLMVGKALHDMQRRINDLDEECTDLADKLNRRERRKRKVNSRKVKR